MTLIRVFSFRPTISSLMHLGHIETIHWSLKYVWVMWWIWYVHSMTKNNKVIYLMNLNNTISIMYVSLDLRNQVFHVVLFRLQKMNMKCAISIRIIWILLLVLSLLVIIRMMWWNIRSIFVHIYPYQMDWNFIRMKLIIFFRHHRQIIHVKNWKLLFMIIVSRHHLFR